MVSPEKRVGLSHPGHPLALPPHQGLATTSCAEWTDHQVNGDSVPPQVPALRLSPHDGQWVRPHHVTEDSETTLRHSL